MISATDAHRTRTSERRVAILVPSLVGGGAERTTLLLAAGLLDRGYEVDLVLRDLVCDYPEDVPSGVRLFFLTRGGAEHRPSLERLPVPPRPLSPNPVRFPRMVLGPALRREQLGLLTSARLARWAASTASYIDRERPDAILARLTPAVVAAAMAGRKARHRVRTVAVLCNKIRSGRDWRRARRSYPFADAAVGVSRGVATELTRLPGLSSERTHVVHNPVALAQIQRKAFEPPEHPWLRRPGSPVVLSVGRLHPQKDFPTLLAAFARVLTRRAARLIVLGKGRELSSLQSLAHELGVSEHVDFPGFTRNPYAYMARARLFVLSSRHEGFPNVLVEAMACGCPVISTDCPFGPDEILEGGRWSELVPVGDQGVLGDAMVRALDAQPRRDDLRQRAEFFSVERAVSRYEELLFG